VILSFFSRVISQDQMSASSVIKKILIGFFLLQIMNPCPLSAAGPQFLYGTDVVVLHDAALGKTAEEVLTIYPKLKGELEAFFGWNLEFVPSILLTRDRSLFGSSLTVAFADPARNLVVIDFTKAGTRPFRLRSTLLHELCHLMMHDQIERSLLPRWLDEGICQWMSGEMGELILDTAPSPLDRAIQTGYFIPLSSLHLAFPEDPEGTLLAYEQSRSFVFYLARRFGGEAVLGILDGLRAGKEMDASLTASLSHSLHELEAAWHRSLTDRPLWIFRIGAYLTELLFTLMALITFYAFVRTVRRKRAYRDESPAEDLDERS
jgi:hypothetical protein